MLGQVAGEVGVVRPGGARPAAKAGAFSAVEASLGSRGDATRDLVRNKVDVVMEFRRSPDTARPVGGDVFATNLNEGSKGAQTSAYPEISLRAVESGAFPAAEAGLEVIMVLD
jgi:hypothetical protein